MSRDCQCGIRISIILCIVYKRISLFIRSGADVGSFKPFVQMEYVYQERGITYMIVAQGTDGDYIKNNALVKGRYKSKDGINFTFDKEISDSPTLAG